MENKSNNLVIYQKFLELLYYTHDIVRKYPKSEKFALVSEIKQTVYEALTNLLFAIKVFNKKDKLNYLNNFDVSLTLLKVQIRLSYKYQYISSQNYEAWSSMLTDISNMLGAWVNSCLKK